LGRRVGRKKLGGVGCAAPRFSQKTGKNGVQCREHCGSGNANDGGNFEKEKTGRDREETATGGGDRIEMNSRFPA